MSIDTSKPIDDFLKETKPMPNDQAFITDRGSEELVYLLLAFDKAIKNWKTCEKEVKKLKAENAALREDKARLDWLASNRSFNMKGESIVLTPESIRASIDDKRKETQP
jgi:hypothetical protein